MANPQHATLVAATVRTFTFDSDYPWCEVLNLSTTDRTYFSTDGSTPAVGADGSHVVPPSSSVEVRVRSTGATVIKAISSGTPLISVRVWRP